MIALFPFPFGSVIDYKGCCFVYIPTTRVILLTAECFIRQVKDCQLEVKVLITAILPEHHEALQANHPHHFPAVCCVGPGGRHHLSGRRHTPRTHAHPQGPRRGQRRHGRCRTRGSRTGHQAPHGYGEGRAPRAPRAPRTSRRRWRWRWGIRRRGSRHDAVSRGP